MESLFSLGSYTAGVASCLAVAAPLGWVLTRKARRKLADHRNQEQTDQERSLLGLYHEHPAGTYAWIERPHAAEFCSASLSSMLNLGTSAIHRIEQIIEKFNDAEAKLLEASIKTLRDTGTAFDLLIPFANQHFHIVGRRSFDDYRGLNGHMLWVHDVTALMGTAPARQDGPNMETQLKALFDALPIPVWLRDPDLALAFSNQAASDQQNLLGDSNADMATRASTNGEIQRERRALDINGDRRIVEITEAPLGPGAGTIGFSVEHFATNNEDKASGTDQQQALDQMLELMSDGVVIYGADKKVKAFNGAFCTLWGLEEDFLLTRPSLTQVLENLRENRKLPEVNDYRLFRAEQNELFEHLKASQVDELFLPDGRMLRTTIAPASTGGLVFVYENITENLNLQREYKNLDAVQRQTIDQLQEAVAVIGSDGRLKLHNQPFADLWGLQVSADKEPHLHEVVAHMRDGGESDSHWLSRQQSILNAFSQRTNHKERFARSNGGVYDVSYAHLPDGAILVSYLDITDETKVKEALRFKADSLEETNTLKSKFIADVSYEVRTPLTTITGFSDILQAQYFGDLNPRQQEYIRSINDTANSLMGMINDILELAAIEGGTVALDRDAVEVHSLLAQSISMITERARHKEIHISFDVPTDIGWLSADERRMKQVIFNLLSNAVRFTPSRGGIRLSAERQGDHIVISVNDTGVGIPQVDIDRVFQKFMKGKQHDGEADGAGLGLSMVKSFVELHGGKVDIKSTPNKGTRVSCILPANGPDAPDARDAFTQ